MHKGCFHPAATGKSNRYINLNCYGLSAVTIGHLTRIHKNTSFPAQSTAFTLGQSPEHSAAQRNASRRAICHFNSSRCAINKAGGVCGALPGFLVIHYDRVSGKVSESDEKYTSKPEEMRKKKTYREVKRKPLNNRSHAQRGEKQKEQ